MTAPTFAVMGRIEQTFDDAFIGIGAAIVQERVNFGDGWRKTDEIEGQAPDECGAGGFGCWLDLFFFEPGQHEEVDWIAGPFCAADFWKRRTSGRNEGP